MQKKLIVLSIILVAIGIMLIPLFTKNHIYQGVALGVDTEEWFIPMMNMASNGASLNDLLHMPPYEGQGLDNNPFLGQALSFWILGKINILLQINPEILFFLFTLALLFCSGLTLYYLGKIINGERSGWIVMTMGLLVNTAVLALYTWGCFDNLLNLYIVFAWSLILWIKWYDLRRWYWLLGGLSLTVLFCILHPSGVYLPFTIAVLLSWVALWRLVKKEWLIPCRHLALLSVVMVGAIILVYSNVRWIGVGEHDIFSLDYLSVFIRLLFAPVPTVIGLLVLFSWIKYRGEIWFNNAGAISLAVLGSLFIVLFVSSGLQISVSPERQILDATGIGAIIVAIMLGHMVEVRELDWLKLSSYALMALQGLITIMAWVK